MNMTRTRNKPAGIASDPRWLAVLARDATAEGRFWYGVVTTGIYCRPTCPSRRPRPANVTFFGTRAQAEEAGFRPCKRCRPDRAALSRQHADKIEKACRTIEASEDQAPDLSALASKAGMSKFYFHRLFKAATGVTPKAYAAAQRAQRVRRELGRASNITEALYEAGYGSNSRFYENAGQLLGMKPAAFRAGGPATEIRFAVGECALGSILVAQSERGVCAILLGDDPHALVRDLQDQFPRARLLGGDRGFERLVAGVVGLIEAPRTAQDLPLDVRGTAFQQRVWQALRDIPPGTTVSYSEIARRIGRPGAARAVAAACAANPLAVAIPCHRVVRNDGAVSGYRWGVERKRKLLEREARG